MHRAAQHLLGQHDFSTFLRIQSVRRKTPVRTLDRIDITRNYGDDIVMEVEARSFLHHQVRNMIGTLCIVGEGSGSSGFCSAFQARDRTKGGVTAPPDGLTLVRIDYPPH